MNRFAAWSTGQRLNDPEGHYRWLIGRPPLVYAPDLKRFFSFGSQDAQDPPNQWNPQKRWDEFIAASPDAWMRNAQGNRIQGWGPGRYAVDLSKAGKDWAGMATQLQIDARQGGAHVGMHWDSLSTLRSYFDPNNLYHDPVAWKANAKAMIATATSPVSGMVWDTYYCDTDDMLKFNYCKYEGFRFYPRFYTPGDGWSGPPGYEKTFDWYWNGHSQGGIMWF